jgi:general stress protein 26
MLEEIKSFINENSYCVLATSNKDIPYCSLMAYLNNDDCTKIYMASYSDTRKVKNLKKNKNLSLIIDSRGTNRPGALTIQGEFVETDKNIYELIFKKFLKKHPGMETFLSNENIELISVDIKAFMYIKGLEDPYYIEVS